jgi:hypothetical protein
MAVLGANYFSGLGCEFGADKGNNDFNDLRPSSSSPRSWLSFFALDKNSFNDYEQLKDKLDSTRPALDDTTRHVRPTLLSVSFGIVTLVSVMECPTRALTTSFSYIDRIPANAFNYSRHISI